MGFLLGIVSGLVCIWAVLRIALHIEKGKWVLDREDFEV